MTKINVLRDLRLLFGPSRDQGVRPTCLAFAVSDTHAALRDGWTPLSCEYTFYHAQRRAGRSPHSGAMLSAMLDAIQNEGQPEENGWPYLPAIPNYVADWKPPTACGPIFRRVSRSGTNLIDDLIRELDRNKPVIVLIMLPISFFQSQLEQPLSFNAANPPDPAQRHAVIAVGHGQYGKERCVLIRNSWGSAWGDQGYAWIAETLIQHSSMKFATLLEDPDVSPHTLAA